MAAAIVNTESEKTDACIATAAQFVIMESGRTDVANAIISLAPSRGVQNTVTNILVRGL